MQHYDGPAFYRRFKEKKVKSAESQSARKVAEYARDEIPMRKTTLHKKHFGENSIPESHPFRPTYVPPAFNHKGSFAKAQRRYQQLYNELAKPAASFYLLANEDEEVAQNDLIFMDIPEHHENVKNSSPDLLSNQQANHGLNPSVEEDAGTTSSAEQGVLENSKISPEQTAVDAAESDSTATLNRTIAENKPAAVLNDETPGHSLATVNTQSAKMLPESTKKIVQNEKRLESEKITTEVPQVENNHFAENSFAQNTPAISQTNSIGKFISPSAAIAEKKRAAASQPLTSSPEKVQATKTSKGYHFPPLSLLPQAVTDNDPSMIEWVRGQKETLSDTLRSFKVNAAVNRWTIGPAVTQFEITLGRGVKVNKITNLADDLKLALAAKDIRIEAPIPGKRSVGIEVPNLHSRPVMLAEVLGSARFQESTSPLTVALGVDLFGRAQVTDLRRMPHGLIAGATGSGKSVFINSLLLSLLYKATPAQVKLLLIDPKAVEMAPYHEIPHLLAPVISDPQAAAAALKWVVTEMEERYQRLAAAGARNLEAYNKKAAARGEDGLKMPYIVIVIDELADLMMLASSEVQDYIARITQKARAAGIHLLIATQRPSVDVITGTIKNNIPTRIAFMVSSQVDSRTIIDTAGAERLLGRGDLLYLGNGASQPLRLQGTFVQDEVDELAEFVRRQGTPHYAFDPAGLKKKTQEAEQEDALFPRVLDYIVNEETISTSKLQRVFSIGYNRAANLIDELEQKQFISPAHGSKPRLVFLTQKDLQELRGQSSS